MGTHRVLVAFASEQGSTAEIARAIASTLRERGLDVDCLPATAVQDVTPYEGVVLGSGVYLPRHLSDGQGFLPRHGAALRDRSVWLFVAGPLGRGGSDPGDRCDCLTDPDSPLVRVGRSVGARGLAAFGATMHGVPGDDAPHTSPYREVERVRGWANAIAADIDGPPRQAPH